MPSLTRGRPVRDPRGLVLLLHGGAEVGLDPIGPRHLPWVRSRVMLAQLQGMWRRAGVEAWLLRYRVRGWNAGHEALPSPVADARWALAQVRSSYGDLPVVLLGHSMGARASVAVVDDPAVRGVVGLAPWFPAGEPVAPLAGKRLVAAHGRADTVTSVAATEAFVRRAAAVAASAELVDMGPLDHQLVRGARAWNAVAAEHTLAVLGS